jgi:starch phosphorylase
VTVLPNRIARLDELAHDLMWSWNQPARALFRRLDYTLWRATAHNPISMLTGLDPVALTRAMQDPAWLRSYDAAVGALDSARAAHGSWCEREHPDLRGKTIAYFSAEFALHQSLPIYAGGLGVLAGDHCKEASDLGVPLVGVGFSYPQGYFRQQLSAEGWQEEVYDHLDWANAPVEAALTADGTPCITAVPLGARTVLLQVWRVRAGGVTLYLLDTDLEQNAPWDRELSARLYGGDREMRIQQEVLLGIGGIRALKQLGIEPGVCHLNEGHAAFVVLERIRNLCEAGWDYDAALEHVRRSTVFTTHTPVAAGHDAFPFSLVETHLASAWGNLGPYRERFLSLGHYDSGAGPMFNMTALALRTAGAVNGVSRLHGEVTRSMWRSIWPGVPVDQLPVTSITNGVHVPTWMSREIGELLERHLGSDWAERHDDPGMCDRVLDIPDDELWTARQSLRTYLFHFIRERTRRRWARERVGAARVVAGGPMLDQEALTIGFARRFTAYKRPELIFSDPDRLAQILTAAGRPVQLVFAGKAHPADEVGKRHLQQIYFRALDPRFGGRVAFVDDYDLHVAHFLVQGCDVWLNNPRKPLEASGTSGMKAAINGAPHFSIGDGWWAEGFTGANGWLIEPPAEAGDQQAQDWADAEAMYTLLEEELVPVFYDRDEHGIPREWLRVVKESIRTVLPRFSARRMVKEYVRDMYAPALRL